MQNEVTEMPNVIAAHQTLFSYAEFCISSEGVGGQGVRQYYLCTEIVHIIYMYKTKTKIKGSY